MPHKIQVQKHGGCMLWLKGVRNRVESRKGIAPFPMFSVASLSSGGASVKLSFTL